MSSATAAATGLAPGDRRAAPAAWAYRPQLDGVRALAMLVVVGFHYEPDYIPGGYLGVTVFFVLSGYLITGLLVAEHRRFGAIDLAAFYVRRALRLYPALIAAVAFLLALATITGHDETSTGALYRAGAASLLYLNDFGLALDHFTIWLDPTWSLGVEEQFYLVWPLVLIAALRRLPGRLLCRCCFGVALLVGLLHAGFFAWLGDDATYFTPAGSALPLLLGAGVALADKRLPDEGWPAAHGRGVRRGQQRLVVGIGAASGAVLLGLIAFDPNIDSLEPRVATEQIAALAAAGLIFHVVVRSGDSVLGGRVTVWLARRSYGIYLIHAGILSGLVNALPAASDLRRSLIGVPISFVSVRCPTASSSNRSSGASGASLGSTRRDARFTAAGRPGMARCSTLHAARDGWGGRLA